jgi:hypothetical protein
MNGALGFRVKSGWAAAVLLTGKPDSPEVKARTEIDLCDQAEPKSCQPYHAAMGTLQTDQAKIERLRKLIVAAAHRSVEELLRTHTTAGFHIDRAGLVTGSDIDPAKITNPHIRAHAFEGRLFRTVLEDALKSQNCSCLVFVEKTVYAQAAKVLRRPEAELKKTVAALGKTLGGPWRSDEKAACVAGWVALG